MSDVVAPTLAAPSSTPQRKLFSGDFTIRDKHDLQAFVGYTDIEGSLTIDETYIESLAPLQSLSYVAGDLVIIWNDYLTDLRGLHNLRIVGGILEVFNNNHLLSLHGLENLISVGRYLRVMWNQRLTNVLGLCSLRAVGGDLSMRANDNLARLTGLENVEYIGGGLYIRDHGSLVTLAGLDHPALRVRGDDFRIWENRRLPVHEVQSFIARLRAPQA